MCRILLPDIPKAHLQIVLKFLYTGRLGITADVQNVVRELLEDVLRIDARISLPSSSANDATQSTSNHDRRQDDDDADGFGGPSHSGEFDGFLSSISNETPSAADGSTGPR